MHHCKVRIFTTAYLSIVGDHGHSFMTTLYQSSNGCFQQDSVSCHRSHIASNWFLEHGNEVAILCSLNSH